MNGLDEIEYRRELLRRHWKIEEDDKKHWRFSEFESMLCRVMNQKGLREIERLNRIERAKSKKKIEEMKKTAIANEKMRPWVEIQIEPLDVINHSASENEKKRPSMKDSK